MLISRRNFLIGSASVIAVAVAPLRLVASEISTGILIFRWVAAPGSKIAVKQQSVLRLEAVPACETGTLSLYFERERKCYAEVYDWRKGVAQTKAVPIDLGLDLENNVTVRWAS